VSQNFDMKNKLQITKHTAEIFIENAEEKSTKRSKQPSTPLETKGVTM
jgi:hypothetical protein